MKLKQNLIKKGTDKLPIMWYFYTICFLLFFIFGNNVLQYKVFGKINFFYLFLFISILSFLKNLVCNQYNFNGISLEITMSIILFFIIGVFFVVISFLGYHNLLNLKGVSVDKSYILRQSYFLILIPIGVDVVYFYSNYSIDCSNLMLLFLEIFFIISLKFLGGIGVDTIILNIVIPFVAAFLYFKNRKIIYLFLYFSCLFIISHQSTYLAGWFVVLCFILFDYFLSRVKFQYKTAFSVLVFTIPIWFFLIVVFLVFYAKKDMNTEWRLQYWQNEFSILRDNLFVGVGFGVGYCSEHLLDYINNASVFTRQGDFVVVSLYIAQHNSFVNVFYRMGICGLFVFIAYNFFMVKEYFYCINRSRYVKLGFAFYIFGLLVIFLNPGLESPRFCLMYFMCTVFYICALIDSKKEHLLPIDKI